MIKQQAAQQQQQKMQSRMLHEEALQAEMEDRMLIEERRRNAADVLVSEMEDQEEIAIVRPKRSPACLLASPVPACIALAWPRIVAHAGLFLAWFLLNSL